MPMKSACRGPSNEATTLEICQKQEGGLAETGRGSAATEEGAEHEESDPGAPQRVIDLVNHVDGFLRGLIEGGYRLRIGLEGALRDNEGRKLGGDVHIGRL